MGVVFDPTHDAQMWCAAIQRPRLANAAVLLANLTLSSLIEADERLARAFLILLFASRPHEHTAEQFTLNACLGRRSVERLLLQNGYAQLKEVVAAARLAKVLDEIAGDTDSLRTAALRAGWASARPIQRWMLRLCGCDVATARAKSVGNLVHVLSDSIQRPFLSRIANVAK